MQREGKKDNSKEGKGRKSKKGRDSRLEKQTGRERKGEENLMMLRER